MPLNISTVPATLTATNITVNKVVAFGYYRQHNICLHMYIPCAILLCGCDNTVVDRHWSLDRLTDWYHYLLLVLLLHHLLIFISHWYLEKYGGSREKAQFKKI